jgi:hypothetical protein
VAWWRIHAPRSPSLILDVCLSTSFISSLLCHSKLSLCYRALWLRWHLVPLIKPSHYIVGISWKNSQHDIHIGLACGSETMHEMGPLHPRCLLAESGPKNRIVFIRVLYQPIIWLNPDPGAWLIKGRFSTFYNHDSPTTLELVSYRHLLYQIDSSQWSHWVRRSQAQLLKSLDSRCTWYSLTRHSTQLILIVLTSRGQIYTPKEDQDHTQHKINTGKQMQSCRAWIREKSSCWGPYRPFILWTIRPFYRTIRTYSRASRIIRLKSRELQDRPMHAKLKTGISTHISHSFICRVFDSHSRFCLEP